MSREMYRNNHDLYPRMGPGPEEACPRISSREATIREIMRIVPAEEQEGYLSRIPEHDERCPLCHGRNVIRFQVRVGYWCKGCGLETEAIEHPDIFDLTSCLGVGAGFYEELRYQHEDGYHEDYRPTLIPGCPLCAAKRIQLRLAEKEAVNGAC